MDSDVVYERIKLLGQGAYGKATLYKSKHDNGFVVLKEIKMKSLQPKDKKIALNEATVLSKLHHPNVIGYLDCYEDEGMLLIEMEYADGGTLADLIAKASELQNSNSNNILFEENIILMILHQLCSALSHCHENAIVHRDLKPQNIFLTKNLVVKLGDFGISKLLQTNLGKDEESGGCSTCIGTPYYISPEALHGKSYNEKADIWSLGCVLYELMSAGKRLFQGNSFPAVISLILDSPIPEFPTHYSQELVMIGKSCVNRDPEGRPCADEILETPILESIESEVLKLWGFNISRKMHRISMYGRRSVADLEGSPGNGGGRFHRGSELVRLMSPTNITEVLEDANADEVCMAYRQISSVSDELGRSGSDYSSRVTKSASQKIPGRATVESKSYFLYHWGNGQTVPHALEEFSFSGRRASARLEEFETEEKSNKSLGKPEKVSFGKDHIAVLTTEMEVYTWGDSSYGQLGHGDTVPHKKPRRIQYFVDNGILINDVCCGEDFTICLTESGLIYTFGNNDAGCCGQDDEKGQYLSPSLVASLKHLTVTNISCGNAHVLALTVNCDIYGWGSGESGRLGTGNEDYVNTPTVIKWKKRSKRSQDMICDIQCGYDSSFFFTLSGKVYATGNNNNNKLGLNLVAGILASKDSILKARKSSKVRNFFYPQFALEPQPLKGIFAQHVVKEIASSDTHTLVLTLSGKLYAMGCNESGELGIGHNKVEMKPVRVNAFVGHPIETIACGRKFSVAYSVEKHTLFTWGSEKYGRLGNGDSSSNGDISVPRPVLGECKSLACVAAGHMSCMVIVEKVLESRTFGKTKLEGLDMEGLAANETERRSQDLKSISGLEYLNLGDNGALDYTDLEEVSEMGTRSIGKGSSMLGGEEFIDTMSTSNFNTLQISDFESLTSSFNNCRSSERVFPGSHTVVSHKEESPAPRLSRFQVADVETGEMKTKDDIIKELTEENERLLIENAK
eukprot:Nk52_evm1s412 gene=Nk52_evmTU1s412